MIMENATQTDDPAPAPRAPAPVGPPTPRQARAPSDDREPRDRSTKAQREMREDEEQDLKSWLNSLAGDAPIQVTITRKRPAIGPNGENVLGTLETVEDMIDEDYISDVWGGGTFELKIKKQNSRGSFEYFKHRTIKIGGDPKMNGRVLGSGGGAAAGREADEPPGIATRVFDVMERNAAAERSRADRLERESRSNNGLDFSALQAMQAPLVTELAEARRQIADLQKEMVSIIAKPPVKDEFRDRLLERSVEGGDRRIEDLRTQYEGRITAMRELYEGRLDKLRDDHHADLKRLEDKHEREMERLTDQHEREITRTEKAAEQSGKGTEVGYQGRIDALKSENTRLERELTALQAKIGALEARKDQSIGEKADELIKVKEALDGIGGGGDNDGDKPWYERLIDAAGNSQAVLDLVAKVGGATGAGPGAGGQQEPPIGQPFYGPDGRVYVRNPDGSYALVQQQPGQIPQRAGGKRKRRAAAQQAVAAAGGALPDLDGDEDGGEDGEELAPPIKPPSQKDIKGAVAFMENAVKSGADPESFARGVQSLLPGETLQYIQQIGPEKFLAKLTLDAGSPLTTQAGRNFVRKVFQTLFGGEG